MVHSISSQLWLQHWHVLCDTKYRIGSGCRAMVDPNLEQCGLRAVEQSHVIYAVSSLDIRGTYVGSGTLTQTNCQNPADNGTFGFSSSATISTQTGSNFSGSATLTTVISGINVTDNISLTGTVTTTGQSSGTFTFTLLANGAFGSSGNGTFTGQVTGNTLTVNFSGQDTVGDTCTFTGSLSGTR